VNNTGTKYVRIMKKNCILKKERERDKKGKYIPCLKDSALIFVE
jgi:hypothetical protein